MILLFLFLKSKYKMCIFYIFTNIIQQPQCNVHFCRLKHKKTSRKTCSSNSYVLNYFSSAFLFVTNTIAPIVAKIADNTQ